MEDVKGTDKNAVYHTGSFENCTDGSTTVSESPASITIDGQDSGTVVLACHEINFRAPLKSFHNENLQILVGVLSSSGGVGPARRRSVRSTWGSSHPTGVFFLVAGPWKDIADEYHARGDLIWIDEEEVYDGARSVLTHKTYAFVAIAHAAASRYRYAYTHLFKTDDDSYVDLTALRRELSGAGARRFPCSRDGAAECRRDFVGQCQLFHHRVHREGGYKWPLATGAYPEEVYAV